MSFNPGVERGLRLFEQQQISVAGFFGGFATSARAPRRQRSRHGHQHLLLVERCVRHFRIPRLPQMLQIAARRFDGRNFWRRLRAHSVAGSAPCDPLRHATATISPKPPGGWPLRRRVSEPGPRQRNAGDSSQGSAIAPAGKSDGPGMYKNDGSNGWSRTSPGFTSCGTSNRATGGCSRGSPTRRHVCERAIGCSEIDADKVLAWQNRLWVKAKQARELSQLV